MYKRQIHAKTLPLTELDSFVSTLPREGLGNWSEILHVVIHNDSVTVVWEQQTGRKEMEANYE